MGVVLAALLILRDPAGFLNGDWRDILAVAGVSITFFGFAVAIWQIRRVASSAQAAMSAAQSTRQELSKNLQLTDLSSAIALTTEIKAAAALQQYDAVSLRLNDLRQLIVRIRAASRHDSNTQQAFQDSVARVGLLEASLLECRGTPGASFEALQVHAALSEVSDFLNELATRARLQTGGNDANT